MSALPDVRPGAIPPELRPDLRCACGQPADTIHAVTGWGTGARFVACCPDADAGGYWIRLEGPSGLFEDWADWEQHLRAKDAPTWERFEAWLWSQPE